MSKIRGRSSGCLRITLPDSGHLDYKWVGRWVGGCPIHHDGCAAGLRIEGQLHDEAKTGPKSQHAASLLVGAWPERAAGCWGRVTILLRAKGVGKEGMYRGPGVVKAKVAVGSALRHCWCPGSATSPWAGRPA